MPPTDPDFEVRIPCVAVDERTDADTWQHWQHDIGEFLRLVITLPVGYPHNKPCEVVIVNENLNPQVRQALGKAIAAEAKALVGKIMVRAVKADSLCATWCT